MVNRVGGLLRVVVRDKVSESLGSVSIEMRLGI